MNKLIQNVVVHNRITMSVVCVFGIFMSGSKGGSSPHSAKEEKLWKEYEAKMKSLDDRERTLNAFLDNNTYTNEENYLAGNLGEQEYARRKFLCDKKEDQYRREYEDSLRALDKDRILRTFLPSRCSPRKGRVFFVPPCTL